jgi:hypothetical protein
VVKQPYLSFLQTYLHSASSPLGLACIADVRLHRGNVATTSNLLVRPGPARGRKRRGYSESLGLVKGKPRRWVFPQGSPQTGHIIFHDFDKHHLLLQTIYRLSDSLSRVPFRIVDGENVQCVSHSRVRCIHRSTANVRLQYGQLWPAQHPWPINRGISQSRLSIVGMIIRLRLSVGFEVSESGSLPAASHLKGIAVPRVLSRKCMEARQKETVPIHRPSLAQQNSKLSAQTYSRPTNEFTLQKIGTE